MLANGFSLIASSASLVSNTTINGLAITGCGVHPQFVTVDTGILPSALQPNASVLQVQPPVDRGFRKIILYALDGKGFSQEGNRFTGAVTGVHLETGAISPAGFSAGVGSHTSVDYSLDLASYPCGALLGTTLWENALPEDKDTFSRIAAGNNAQYLGTAYTTKIARTNLPSTDDVTLHMSVNSSWGLSHGDRNARIAVERIADDRSSGEVLHTTYLNHDPQYNLDNYEADSPRGLSTFGLSAITGNDNPFQLVPLTGTGYVSSQPGISPSVSPGILTSPETNPGITGSSTAGTAIPVTVSPGTSADPGQTTPLFVLDSNSWIIDLALHNTIIIVAGIALLVLAIYLYSRKPRRYRVYYND
jgi:hypothetical protein